MEENQYMTEDISSFNVLCLKIESELGKKKIGVNHNYSFIFTFFLFVSQWGPQSPLFMALRGGSLDTEPHHPLLNPPMHKTQYKHHNFCQIIFCVCFSTHVLFSACDANSFKKFKKCKIFL